MGLGCKMKEKLGVLDAEARARLVLGRVCEACVGLRAKEGSSGPTRLKARLASNRVRATLPHGSTTRPCERTVCESDLHLAKFPFLLCYK